jgi:hypothetical protein
MRQVTAPYRREVAGGKGSIVNRTNSYHTKFPPDGVVPMIEHYTHPGDRCGWRITGVVRGHEKAHASLTTCDGLRLPCCRLRGSFADGLGTRGER